MKTMSKAALSGKAKTKKPKASKKMVARKVVKLELSQSEKDVLKTIRKASGLLRAEITKKTGCGDLLLTLALRKLKDERLVRSKGKTRATLWFPTAKALNAA